MPGRKEERDGDALNMGEDVRDMVHALVVHTVQLLIRGGHEEQPRSDEELSYSQYHGATLSGYTHERREMPERAHGIVRAGARLVPARIECVLAVRVAVVGYVRRVLRRDEANLADASATCRHQRVPKDHVNLQTG